MIKLHHVYWPKIRWVNELSVDWMNMWSVDSMNYVVQC